MSCSDEMEPPSNIIQIQPSIINRLKKAKYGVSNHSTVELCHWTKKSFANEGECYKKKFYGIDTHRCWESLLCGAIPIMYHTPIDPILETVKFSIPFSPLSSTPLLLLSFVI